MEKWSEIFNLLTTGECPWWYSNSQKFQFKKYSTKFTVKDGELFCGNKKVVKTKEEAQKIVDDIHTSLGGHLGMMKTRNAVSARFFWKGMTKDIENWVRECEKCKKAVRPLMDPQPLNYIKVSAVWELVAIDITGPHPQTQGGFQYIMAATDYFTKWVEAFPLKSKSVAEVGRHLCSLFCRHGFPKQVLCDLDRDSISELNSNICRVLEIERSFVSAYDSQSNGLDKKINDNLKRVLSKLISERQDSWDVYLDPTLFSLRSKIHNTTKNSPFLLMYGREAVYPCEVPEEIPASSFTLPEHDHTYATFLEEKQKLMESLRVTTLENLEKAQDKQRMVYKRKAEDDEVPGTVPPPNL